MIYISWKNYKILKFWVLDFGFGLQNFFWPLKVFLRSLVSKKSSGMQKSYVWAIFHAKQFLLRIFHFGLLCVGRWLFLLLNLWFSSKLLSKMNKKKMASAWRKIKNSILLHSGLNPAWHFWLSTRFSCCLKMKSVENILGYIREQFYRFSRGCKPRENLWNCSRKYTKMFKTDSFLGNKKLSLNQNVWRDHATMQQDVLLHFWVIFLHWNQAEIWKNILLSSSRAFSLSTPMENSAVCQL